MRIENEIKLDFKDVLIRPKRSTLNTRSEVVLEREYHFRHSIHTWSGIPIIASNMDHTGTLAMAKALAKHQFLTAVDKYLSPEEWNKEAPKDPATLKHCFVSTGIGEEDLERMHAILQKFSLNAICLDVANGYTQRFVDIVKRLRNRYPDKIMMAGNVVTAEMAEELVLAGADIVKVGIGPGSVCTTRKMTGVGYPQLSAIIECADAVHGLSGHLCADGGCTTSGDVAKAFAGGADFVMLGGMLAGHEECQGELLQKETSQGPKSFKRFYGMSSVEAMKRHRGGVGDYQAGEGKSVDVPYKGSVENTILDLLGGLRSACTYVGAAKLKELSKRTTFVRVTQQLNEVFTPFQVESTNNSR